MNALKSLAVVFGLFDHQGLELLEVDGAVLVGVDHVEHLLALFSGAALSDAFHEGGEFFEADASVLVSVDHGEHLFDSGHGALAVAAL